MIMKKISLIIIVLIISLLIFATFTSKINPVTWEIAPNPGLIGDFKLNNKLAESNLILQGVGEGPEDIAQGPDGSFYTGYQDGLIIRFSDERLWHYEYDIKPANPYPWYKLSDPLFYSKLYNSKTIENIIYISVDCKNIVLNLILWKEIVS